MLRSLVGSEMCIRDRVSTQSTGGHYQTTMRLSSSLLLVAVLMPAVLAGPIGNPMADTCPGSKALVHASCQMQVEFTDGCADVRAEVLARVNGAKTGAWVDPHNNGTYTLTGSTAEQLLLMRATGGGGGGGTGYNDQLILTLSDNGSGCSMTACSESQVTSVIDFSTNYCNLHDLYCSDGGCHVQSHSLSYKESLGIHCMQHDMTKCYKV
eukprot:TRINITY_DN68_c0_g1_i1.p1 TRINITY_DN68_c0_g1~~TRINITY_DN68_c0_g1_i1.p1  ORF type:complete len:210 (-),score=56.34 TRINITY_DN68_c0_g1_i1:337-966(-)